MKILAVTITFLLTGCAHWFGPADGFFYAVGSTPGGSSCTLSVLAVGSEGAPREVSVSGPFREAIIINPSGSEHRMSLSCGGEVVASRTFKYGRDVSIGGELAVSGSAP